MRRCDSSPAPASSWSAGVSSQRSDVRRLQALRAFSGLELDALVLFQRAVSARLDCGVVREDVRAAVVWCDEAEALLCVEPLDGAGSAHSMPFVVCDRERPQGMKDPTLAVHGDTSADRPHMVTQMRESDAAQRGA